MISQSLNGEHLLSIRGMLPRTELLQSMAPSQEPKIYKILAQSRSEASQGLTERSAAEGK